MFLKIKNKNNNKEYPLRTGLTITDNYNETLDSAEIVISHIKEEIDIEPFDECEIISDTFIKGFIKETDERYHYYMAIDSYRRIQLSIETNPYYEYQISLFSQTKYLEGIILPSLKITQWQKTYKKRVYKYLTTYLNEYGLKIRVKTSNSYEFRPKWVFAERVRDRFFDVVCPEMQRNNATLRQVLTDLMMVDDCIPVLRNNVIDYIDISKEKAQASNVGVNFIQDSQSSADYVSELRMNIQNAIQDDLFVDICEKISFRNSSVGVISDQDIRLETTYPIYDLISLKAEMWCNVDGRIDGVGDVGYTSYIEQSDLVKEGVCVEKGVYDVKKIWYKEWSTEIPKTFDIISKYQNFNVYYSRGNRNIEGWNVLTNSAYVLQDKVRTVDVINKAMLNNKSQVTLPDGKVVTLKADRTLVGNPVENMFFEVKYKTTADALFQASKSERATNNRVVVDNQTNSYVDANAQGILEYIKANRLGNKMKLINARYNKNEFNNVAELGEKYDDSIIFKRDISYFDDYIMANYYATKDYVLRDYFTGVKAKQRSWKLIDGKDALERHDLIKYYLEFSRKDTLKQETSSETLNFLPSRCLYSFEKLKLYNYAITDCALNFKDAIGKTYPTKSTDSYQAELISRVIGNSIVYSFGLNDNIYFGKYIEGKVKGGLGQLPYAYADENGENIGGELTLSRILPMNQDVGDWEDLSTPFLGGANLIAPILDKMTSESFLKPKINKNQISNIPKIVIPFNFAKDNSEITRLSVQFEFCSDDENIVFGKKFIEMQTIIGGNIDLNNLKLYTSKIKPSYRNQNYLPDDKVLVNDSEWSIDDNKNTITITGSIGNNSVYITDIDDNVIFAYTRLKTDEPNKNVFYLNLLKDRNKNIYDDNGNIVDNIYL